MSGPISWPGLTQNSILVFALADANEHPTPETKDEGEKGPREPIDLTLEVVDGAGEVVFQHFECPLAAFVAANPAFDPTGLAQVRFVFDRTQMEVIALDDIGFRD